MKTIILSLLFALLFFFPLKSTLVAQSNWITINSGISEDNLKNIQFVNSAIGFIVGTRGIVLKTTDSGLSWEQKSSGLSFGLNTVHFINSQTGLAVGSYGQIIRTTNSGENWVLITSPETSHLIDIYFVNDLIGYISGQNTTLLKTTDGGITWLKKGATEFGIYFACYFFNATEGLVANSYLNIRKTTNSGNNWIEIYTPPDIIYDLYFIDQIIGLAVGFDGFIIKTTNSGNNWSIIQGANQGYHLRKMCFATNDLGYAVGRVGFNDNGVIIRTINRGSVWTVESYTSAALSSVTYNMNGHIFAVGDSGRIYRTEHPIGIQNISSEIPENFSLSQNYPNPFNPNTTIRFELPKSGSVKLVVYDALGREVITLVNEQLKPGTYEAEWDASGYPSGVYYYRLQAGDFIETRKMLLVK